MNTVIVPIDFSETSLNAAHYAVQFLAGHYNTTIILYHNYAKASEAETAEQHLRELKDELMSQHIVKMEMLIHEGHDFIEELERAVRHRSADLVIMGITGRSTIGQVFIGSNTLKMAETKACPVLIIPEKAQYRPVKNVMLSSDFKRTLAVTPSVPIKNFLDVSKAKLHIVNVDADHYIALSEKYEAEKQSLQLMFEEYNPEFYFMRLYDIDEALNLFATERNIDLIIAIQHKNSFIDKLFKRSRTKSLTYQSNVPILVVHE